MFELRRPAAALLAAASVAGMFGAATTPAQAQTIKAVMHSDVKILDPIWTTAYIQRNFGYMVWDTLFAMDEKFEVKPQMVDKWEVSPDKLTWTFTLRDGLVWSNGQPVTSEDCIASIKRWGAKDSMGQKMMASVAGFEAVNDKTFRMKMKEPYGLVLESLGKPSSNVPFMMPKKTADTDPNTQIKVEDVIGSGPFIFKADEWKPGEKVVFVKNPKYKPRSEPPSGLAGGKVAKVDRVEWIAMPDVQTQVAAIENGEIDMIESPGHDLLPLLSKDKNIKLFDSNPLGNQYTFRFNSLFKPFNDPKIRHAVMVAFNQEEFLKATIGNPRYYKVCKAPFVCGTPLGTDEGMKDVLNGDTAKAKQLLKEAGYDGTPVVLMQSTDLQVLTNLAPVAKAQLEAAGFKVDMQAMDWQTLVGRRNKKDPPDKGGWNAFLTSWVAADILNPVMAGFFNASCDKAMFGWPCDATIEKMRDAFAHETDPAKQKQIAIDLQKYWVDHPTHINVGQWYQPVALRTNIDGMLVAPVPVFWNMTKK
ncbi:ABC transporter substrate-binding protein [Enhydrobacter sp.]|jgi:peptide/nickel transport system substrate-binding protein|uniref:ABC transporter substrate-binding protein n=1 Tax=Enhydrobacter sp. TaxID=1894999 RepID=UPI0026309134|nr:ABC transporter substrate-binding protein [Enhydrobacter sp.]WIM10452.1 MAG: ABC transporter, substrate-binding protein (cluster 5, nickel/peptides/opines) [Enhydrobacter sp.]